MDYGLDESDAQAGLDAFARALALAESDAIRSRVEKASVCAYRAALEPIWYTDGKLLEPEMAKRMRPLARRFFELCDKHGIDMYNEGGEVAGAQKRLKKAFGLSEDDTF